MPNQPENAAGLPTIERPNGKVYKPRKITAYPVGSVYAPEDFNGVIVFGTHDIDRAKAVADRLVERDYHPTCEAIQPSLVWWRDGMQNGQRQWLDDEVSGRAGVYFADIADKPREAASA